MEKAFDIYWNDLTEEKQREIATAMGWIVYEPTESLGVISIKDEWEED